MGLVHRGLQLLTGCSSSIKEWVKCKGQLLYNDKKKRFTFILLLIFKEIAYIHKVTFNSKQKTSVSLQLQQYFPLSSLVSFNEA